MRSISSKIRSRPAAGAPALLPAGVMLVLRRQGAVWSIPLWWVGLRGLVSLGSLLALYGFAEPAALAQQPQAAPQPAQSASSDAVLAAQLRAVIASDTTPFAVGHTDFSRYTTPGYCLAAVRHAITLGRSTIAAQEALDIVRRDAVHDTLPARVTAVARACAARFPVASTSVAELPHLFQLAVLAEQETVAEAVLTRRLALAKSPSTQATLLSDAVTTYLAAAPARVAAAEAMVARLDALGSSAAVLSSRLYAHQALLAAADSMGDEPRVRSAAAALLTLARATPPRSDAGDGGMMAAYQVLGRLAYVHAPDSLVVLARELQRDAQRVPALKGYAAMPVDSVVGYLSPQPPGAGPPTPALHAEFWFPAAGQAPGQALDTVLPRPGKVSLFVSVPADCYAYTGGSFATPLDPIGGGCQRIYNLIRRWRAQYGAKLDLTAVMTTASTVAVLLTGPQPAAEAARSLRWYVFDYLRLPVNRLAVQTVPMTAPLPAPDGRVFVKPLVDVNPSAPASPPPQLMGWWEALSAGYSTLLPFQRVYQVSVPALQPTLVVTGPDGRSLYSGEPSATLDAVLARALASQSQVVPASAPTGPARAPTTPAASGTPTAAGPRAGVIWTAAMVTPLSGHSLHASVLSFLPAR